MTDKKNKESKNKVKRRNSFAMILNGEFLTKDFVLNNLSFIFFIILLMLLSVGKGYYSKKLKTEKEDSQKKLQQLKADYVETNARFGRWELTGVPMDAKWLQRPNEKTKNIGNM